MTPRRAAPPDRMEWPTVALIAICYAGWTGAVFLLPDEHLALAIGLCAVALTLHSSLSHEVLHGHPFPSQAVNVALVAPPLGLVVPYARFRDLHLAHHRDADLTDPYDDPESNYLDPAVWQGLPRWKQRLFAMNNTLLGRMALGPAIGTVTFLADDLRIARLDRAVARVWLGHGVLVVAVLATVSWAPMPLWAYALACYLALSILRIRTFAEHRAHDKVRGRTVIIEDRGPLAFLFLNNNLHVVHHMHPRAPWYTLPRLYRARVAHYRACNDHYVFRNYAQVFRQHLVRAKDPVPHPLWSGD